MTGWKLKRGPTQTTPTLTEMVSWMDRKFRRTMPTGATPEPIPLSMILMEMDLETTLTMRTTMDYLMVQSITGTLVLIYP
jgi:hypothetical protein